jgi:hypothetical protein
MKERRSLVSPSLIALLCCLLAAAGCGRGSSLDVRTVAGTVKVDGVPLAEGRITLRGLSGDTRGFSAPIERGKYRVEAFPGKAQVAITAYREVPGKMDSGGGPGTPPVPVREQFIPAHYNDQTKIEIDVPQGGNWSLNFDLSSAPAAAAAAPNR